MLNIYCADTQTLSTTMASAFGSDFGMTSGFGQTATNNGSMFTSAAPFGSIPSGGSFGGGGSAFQQPRSIFAPMCSPSIQPPFGSSSAPNGSNTRPVFGDPPFPSSFTTSAFASTSSGSIMSPFGHSNKTDGVFPTTSIRLETSSSVDNGLFGPQTTPPEYTSHFGSPAYSGGKKPLDAQTPFSPQTNIFAPSPVSKCPENNSIFSTMDRNVFRPPTPQGLMSTTLSPFNSLPNPFTANVQPSFTTDSAASTAPAWSTWTWPTRNTLTSPSEIFKGTRVERYTATFATDNALGVDFQNFYSISAMPVYKGKSHEELRFEDYELCNKGGQKLLGDESSNPQALSPQTNIPHPSISIFPGNSSIVNPTMNINVFTPISSPFSMFDIKITLTSLPCPDSSSTGTPNNGTFPPLLNAPFSSPSSVLISPFSTTSTPTTTPAPSMNLLSPAKFVFPCQNTVAPSSLVPHFSTTSTPSTTSAPSTNPFSPDYFLFPSQRIISPSTSVSPFCTTSASPTTSAPSRNPFFPENFVFPSTLVSPSSTTSKPTTTPAPSTSKSVFCPTSYPFFVPSPYQFTTVPKASTNSTVPPCHPSPDPSGLIATEKVGTPGIFFVTPAINIQQSPRTGAQCLAKFCENKAAGDTCSFHVKVGSIDDIPIEDEEFPLQGSIQEACDGSEEVREAEVLALMPKLVHGGDYYIEPSIEELTAKEKSEPGFCSRVKDFVLGRKDYGSIKFFGETDVRRLDLQSIVQFNDREVIVYPDDRKKPSVGESLNKPAEITLLNVKCMSKKTLKHYVDGPQVQSFKEMLIKTGSNLGAEFVSFDPVCGVWKFRVQHF